MRKQTLSKPTTMDISPYGQQNIHYTIVSSLEKKYPGHDFAVFGNRLYVDDKDIPFAYNDENTSLFPNIFIEVDEQVSKIV